MLRDMVYWPARFYQRYRPWLNRLPAAALLAWLFWATDQHIRAYPDEWRLFLTSVLALAGLYNLPIGYGLFIIALFYPLYTISIYLAVLALAFLVPPLFYMSDDIPAILLVLATPALVPYRLAPAVPALAGLLWGESLGTFVGVTAAWWLQILAAMAGLSPDLTQLGGHVWPWSFLIERFRQANSLQTLQWALGPLAPDPRTFLRYILQVIGWGLAGYFVGLLHYRLRRSRPIWAALLPVPLLTALGLFLGYAALPMAFRLQPPGVIPWSGLVDGLAGGAAAAVVALVLHYLTGPVLARPRPIAMPEPSPPRAKPQPISVPRPRAHPEESPQDDIIMIDLD
ncbi:MAG: hypothetical protein GXO36_00010 [Chloroflexi bacterium]|nr:hypothetical protein [Chloroflexota bacterium]